MDTNDQISSTPSVEPCTQPQVNDQAIPNAIILSEEKLAEIKADLTKIIDSMPQNPSAFNRLAKKYGELPLWAKVLVGLVVTVPILASGIATQVGILIAIGIMTTVVYSFFSALLTNHYKSTVNVTEHLKKGILSIANMLGTIIHALEGVRKKLSGEIERFKTQNTKLEENVTTLSGQVELFTQTETQLRTTKNELESTVTRLEKNIDTQEALLNETKDMLDKSKKEQEDNAQKLSEKIVELAQLSSEITQAKKLAGNLKDTVDVLTSTVIADEAQREKFKASLNECLMNGQQTIAQSIKRIHELELKLENVERKLVEVEAKLEKNNERFTQSLDRHENQVARLEKAQAHTLSPDSFFYTPANASSQGSEKNLNLGGPSA